MPSCMTLDRSCVQVPSCIRLDRSRVQASNLEHHGTPRNPQSSRSFVETKSKKFFCVGRVFRMFGDQRQQEHVRRNQNTLGHVETSNLKNTGVVRRRTVFGVEPYTRIYAWASNLSRVYNSITALNLDLIFPTEPTFECNIAHIALRAALASIASLTAIISSQYKPQRLPLGGLHQPYLLQVHGRLESLLASSAPIFVISSAAYFGATILLHHYQSHDPYQNLFIIAGALCGLLFDIRSENWVSIGRNVPIFIAIAMILSIVRYGFSETFPTLRASKLSIGQELRRQFVVGHMGGLRSLVGLKRGSDSLPWTDADC